MLFCLEYGYDVWSGNSCLISVRQKREDQERLEKDAEKLAR